MKKLILLITLSLVVKIGFNQNWAPVGATWYYEVGYPFSNHQSYVQYTSVGDTIINNKLCSIIARTDGAEVPDRLIGNSDTAYTYEEENKVYAFDASNNNFSLIYNFDADSGEIWITTWDTCSYVRQIFSMDSIYINGIYVKTFSIGGFTIIDGIGGEFTLFHGLGYVECNPPDTIIWEDPIISILRCYEDDYFGFYNTGIAPVCDYVVGSTEIEAMNEVLKVYPNPSKDYVVFETDHQSKLNLQQNDFELSLFNSFGQQIKNCSIYRSGNTIVWNSRSIPSGVYMYTFIGNGMVSSGKIVIQK